MNAFVKRSKRLALNISDKMGILRFSRSRFKHLGSIVMYHGFSGEFENGNMMPARLFRKQIIYLKNNFNLVPLQDIVERLNENRPIDNMVAITVDDGFHNFYEYAFPLLRENKIPATCFLATDFLDHGKWHWPDQVYDLLTRKASGEVRISFPERRTIMVPVELEKRKELIEELISALSSLPSDERDERIKQLSFDLGLPLDSEPPGQLRALTWNEVREMNLAGIDFGPHTCSHSCLSKLNIIEVEKEIIKSKDRIIKELGKEYNIFCYPFGKNEHLDEKVISVLYKQGFIAAVTGEYGFINSKTTSMMMLPRIPAQLDFLRFKYDANKFELLKNLFR